MFVREMRCCSVFTVIVDCFKDGHLRCQGQKTMKKTDIASFYKEMFNVGDDADDGGVDQAVNVAVAEHTK